MMYSVNVILRDGDKEVIKVEATCREHAAYLAGAQLRTRHVDAVRVVLDGFDDE